MIFLPLVIQYIEDPVFTDDIEGWHKLLAKFNEHRVKIGSRKLYANLSDAKKHSD